MRRAHEGFGAWRGEPRPFGVFLRDAYRVAKGRREFATQSGEYVREGIARLIADQDQSRVERVLRRIALGEWGAIFVKKRIAFKFSIRVPCAPSSRRGRPMP